MLHWIYDVIAGCGALVFIAGLYLYSVPLGTIALGVMVCSVGVLGARLWVSSRRS